MPNPFEYDFEDYDRRRNSALENLEETIRNSSISPDDIIKIRAATQQEAPPFEAMGEVFNRFAKGHAATLPGRYANVGTVMTGYSPGVDTSVFGDRILAYGKAKAARQAESAQRAKEFLAAKQAILDGRVKMAETRASSELERANAGLKGQKDAYDARVDAERDARDHALDREKLDIQRAKAENRTGNLKVLPGMVTGEGMPIFADTSGNLFTRSADGNLTPYYGPTQSPASVSKKQGEKSDKLNSLDLREEALKGPVKETIAGLAEGEERVMIPLTGIGVVDDAVTTMGTLAQALGMDTSDVVDVENRKRMQILSQQIAAQFAKTYGGNPSEYETKIIQMIGGYSGMNVEQMQRKLADDLSALAREREQLGGASSDEAEVPNETRDYSNLDDETFETVFDALPAGTKFIGPDGKEYKKR